MLAEGEVKKIKLDVYTVLTELGYENTRQIIEEILTKNMSGNRSGSSGEKSF